MKCQATFTGSTGLLWACTRDEHEDNQHYFRRVRV